MSEVVDLTTGPSLRKLVKRWIVAEYNFRLGPYCFTNHTTRALVEAEAALREAVGDDPDLMPAAFNVKPGLAEEDAAMRKRMSKLRGPKRTLGDAMTGKKGA